MGHELRLTKPIRHDDLHKAIISVFSIEEKAGILTKLVTKHTIVEEHRENIRILLAEDYPTNQQVAMRSLHRAGYQVELVEDGRQAVEAFKRKHFDLILMDIQMPEMDGYEATKAIRNLECGLRNKIEEDPYSESEIQNLKSKVKRIPIVAMTAHAIKGYRERSLEAGMDDYITKPLRRKGFLAMVDKWTGGIENCRFSRRSLRHFGEVGLNIEDRENKNDDPEKPSTINHQSSIVNSQ